MELPLKNENIQHYLDQDILYHTLLFNHRALQRRSTHRCMKIINAFMWYVDEHGVTQVEPAAIVELVGFKRTSLYRYFHGISGIITFAANAIMLMPAEQYRSVHIKVLMAYLDIHREKLDVDMFDLNKIKEKCKLMRKEQRILTTINLNSTNG